MPSAIRANLGHAQYGVAFFDRAAPGAALHNAAASSEHLPTTPRATYTETQP